jgi:Protein of unknown function (DUF732)
MKRLLMLLGLSAMIIAAAPAYADDSAPNNDDDFLKQIKDAGLTYQDGPKTVEVAKSLCALANSGTNANEIQKDLVSLNPSLAGDGAAKFMTLAAAEYCPKQMHE